MKRLSLLVLGASVVACGGQHAETGARPTHKVIRMSHNYVGGQRIIWGSLELNVEKTIEGDSARYELFVRWTGDVEVNISSKESLDIAADRERLVFSAPQKAIYHDMNCDRRCTYDDRAYYPATAEQIRTIAGAKSVLVRVVGTKRVIEREFN